MLQVNDNRKIGIGLTLFGALFLFLGVLLLFDKALLALGNFLFLSGIVLLIGFQRTLVFFYRKGKIRGTVCFLGGMILVLVGWTVVGMIIELFGIVNLFGNFFPIVLSTLRTFPVIGPILNIPAVARFTNVLVGSILPVSVTKR